MAIRKNEARWIENRCRWQVNVTNDDGERKTLTDSTPGKRGKVACERKADDWLEHQNVGSSTRVEVLFDEFIQNLKDRNTSKLYWGPYEGMGKNWIKPKIGTKKIKNLTEDDLEGILRAGFSKDLSLKYLKNIRSCIMAFLKYCRKRKATTLNPEELEIPKGAPESEKFTLQPDEIKVLFSSPKTMYVKKVCDDFYIHAYRFQVLMGYRPSELAGFQNGDINGDIIKTNRGIVDYVGETNLKNKNAKRSRKINAYAMKELEAQRTMLKKLGIVTKWVFPNRFGGVMDQGDYRRSLNRYLKHNKIGERMLSDGTVRHITPYEMRHTWVSLNDGMPDGLKKKAVGWSQSFDGDRVYGHEVDTDAQRIAEYEANTFSGMIE